MLDVANYLGKRIAHHALVHSDSANDGRRELVYAYYYSKRSIHDQDAIKIILSDHPPRPEGADVRAGF